MRKRYLILTALIFVLIGIAACVPAPTAAPTAPTATAAPQATEAPKPTEPPKPTAAPAQPTMAAAQPAATAKPATAPAQAAGPDPAKIKEVLTTGYAVDAETFDPHYTRGTGTGAMTSLIYEQLVTRDTDTMELKPMLAVSWKNVDPLTWEFKLRQGVKFQNGEAFDAESVKASFARMTRKDLNTLAKSFIEGVYDSIEIVDPYTVRIKTKNPDPYWVSRIAPEGVNMIPPKWAASTDDKTMAQKPVGSGPYRLVEFVPGDRTVLERNESYWGDKPPTKRLVWKTIPEIRTRIAALQRGEIDIARDLEPDSVALVEKDANLKIFTQPNPSPYKIIFNVSQKGPDYMQDKRVRQALNYAVDKKALIKGLFNGMATEYFSVVSREMNDYAPGTPYDYNPDKAKKLLADAGYPNGFETEIWVATNKWQMGEEAVQAIADYFAKVGVKAKVHTAEWAVYQTQASSFKIPTMFYYPHANRMWESDLYLGFFLPERQRWAYLIPPTDVQDLIRKSEQEFDDQKRDALSKQAQLKLWDEAPYLTLYEINYILGMNKKVQNYKMSADGTDRFRQAYIEN